MANSLLPPTTDDLWRECASWLTRCEILPPDHKANSPESEIRVLGE